jgi:hypothetical protein
MSATAIMPAPAYHPLFLFNQFGDLERCALRPDPVRLCCVTSGLPRMAKRRRVWLQVGAIRRMLGKVDLTQNHRPSSECRIEGLRQELPAKETALKCVGNDQKASLAQNGSTTKERSL